jgi:3-hydroxyacyl-CoA dehydrogenase/enoyl-CoA hydratase/3-hydroxybutyryl-CoA epimerase
MSKTILLKIEGEFAVIEIDQPDSKVNVLSAAALMELEQAVSELRAKQGLKGVCIISNKPGVFIAGADIKEIEKISTVSEARDKARAGQKIINSLEDLSVPVIALINGVCLGGGFELALACDYRLATFSDKVKLGLPEVKLGIIPGFGGTKRLPRLVGLRKGIELIVSGEALSADKALKIGVLDGLVNEFELLQKGIEFLRQKSGKRRKYAPRLKGLMNVALEKTFIGRKILKSQVKKFILKNTKGFYPAPLIALDVVIKNYFSPLSEALEREASYDQHTHNTP